jgi:hypothetical protein
VRRFFRDYRTYEKIFQDRKESKSIPAAEKPVVLIRCVEERLLKRLAKYEIGVALDELTTEAITEYLKALVEDTSKELSLEQLFDKLRFDLTSKEPGEIFGDVFQKVEDLRVPTEGQ